MTIGTVRDNSGAVLLVQQGVVLQVPSHLPHHLEVQQVRVALPVRVITEHVSGRAAETALVTQALIVSLQQLEQVLMKILLASR